MPDSEDSAPRGSWATLFQQTSDAVFLLNPRRRLRYVNHAFETLTRAQADAVVHEYCHPRKVQKDMPAGRRALLQTLAPPSEVMQGRIVRVRRPVPPAKLGPPWWDIEFVPLREADKLIGVLGVIVPIGQTGSGPAGKTIPEATIGLRQQAIERFPLSRFDRLGRVRRQAELAAKTLAPVWIVGASGTGKETLARAIHYHRATRELAFAAIDCGGLQPYLVRSLLFGHNGLAEGGRVGTIYLKSPEFLAADLQTELIEWSELLANECRIVVASHSDSVASAEFRAAFGVIEIRIPTLRERKDELPGLLQSILEREASLPTTGVSPEALALLSEWPWPGNLREFHVVVRDANQRAQGGRIELEHLPLPMRQGTTDARAAAATTNETPIPKLDEVLEQVERRMIDVALRKSKGDQTAAAQLLGVHRSRIVRRIKLLGLGDAP